MTLGSTTGPEHHAGSGSPSLPPLTARDSRPFGRSCDCAPRSWGRRESGAPVSEPRRTVRDVTDHHADQERAASGERVPTWRDGVLLSPQQVALLTPDQLQQYLDDSVVRDLAEIEQMP